MQFYGSFWDGRKILLGVKDDTMPFQGWLAATAFCQKKLKRLPVLLSILLRCRLHATSLHSRFFLSLSKPYCSWAFRPELDFTHFSRTRGCLTDVESNTSFLGSLPFVVVGLQISSRIGLAPQLSSRLLILFCGFFLQSWVQVTLMDASSDDSVDCPTSTWIVQWPQKEEPRPSKKLCTPQRPLGGLPRPQVGQTPRRAAPVFKGTPLRVPSPRPPPRSLQSKPGDTPTPSTQALEVEPAVVPVKGLVMPTSSPPDICRVSRLCFQTSMQTWSKAKQQYEVWLTSLILEIKSASIIYCEFAHQPTFKTVVTQLLAQIGPSTLDFYSKGIQTMIVWMQFFEVTWESLSLQSLVAILCQAREAAKHDAQGIRIQPPHLLQSLKWLAKTALMQNLTDLLQGALISNFCKGTGVPKDRREAVPLPFMILARWEETVSDPSSPDWLKLLLGGFLLAIWSSLRYADLQRVELQTLNLAPNTLRGLCRVTKTTKVGQPFAVILAGLTAFSSRSSWVHHWLIALQASITRSHPFQPDFAIPVLDSYHSPSMKAPLSYSAALRALRWAIQTPWKGTIIKSSAAQTTLAGSSASRSSQTFRLGPAVLSGRYSGCSLATTRGLQSYTRRLETSSAYATWWANSFGRAILWAPFQNFSRGHWFTPRWQTFSVPTTTKCLSPGYFGATSDAGHARVW